MSTEFLTKLNELVAAAMRCGFAPTGSKSEQEAAKEINALTEELVQYVSGLEAVVKAAKEYIHDCDAVLRGEPTLYEYEPGEDPRWRLREALEHLDRWKALVE